MYQRLPMRLPANSYSRANIYEMSAIHNNNNNNPQIIYRIPSSYPTVYNSSMTQAHSSQPIPYNSPFNFAVRCPPPLPQPVYNHLPQQSCQQFQPNQSFMHPANQFIPINHASNMSMIQTPVLNTFFTSPPPRFNHPQIHAIPDQLPASEPFSQFFLNSNHLNTAHFLNQSNILSRPVNQSLSLDPSQSSLNKENVCKNQSSAKENYNDSNLSKQVIPTLAGPRLILSSNQLIENSPKNDSAHSSFKVNSISLPVETLSMPNQSVTNLGLSTAESNKCEPISKSNGQSNSNSNSNEDSSSQHETISQETEPTNTQKEVRIARIEKKELLPSEVVTNLIEKIIASAINTAELNLIKKLEINKIMLKNDLQSELNSSSFIFATDSEDELDQQQNNKSFSCIQLPLTSDEDNNFESAALPMEPLKMNHTVQNVVFETEVKECEKSKVSPIVKTTEQNIAYSIKCELNSKLKSTIEQNSCKKQKQDETNKKSCSPAISGDSCSESVHPSQKITTSSKSLNFFKTNTQIKQLGQQSKKPEINSRKKNVKLFERSKPNEITLNKIASTKKRKSEDKSPPKSISKRMKSIELRSSACKLSPPSGAKIFNDPIQSLLAKNDDVFCADDEFDEDFYLKIFKIKKCFVNLTNFNEN